jgi:hypothetical protein
MSGGRVTRLAVTTCVLLVAADLLVTGHLGWIFDLGFVAMCIGAALAVHPRGFFRVGVMPPFLLLGISLFLAVADRRAVALANDTFVQAVVSGLAHHSGALFAGVVNTLVVLAIRHRVTHLRRDRAARQGSPYAYPNLETSPPPTRVTSGAPEEKSTTVVGSDEASPPSRTASSL